MTAIFSNTIRVKNCSACGDVFNCGDTPEGSKCWCNNFPPIFTPSEVVDCLCSICFKASCSSKIDEYLAKKTPENALNNKAKYLPKITNLLEGIDYYIENGNYVFKAFFHLKRGHCCANGWRYCPYGFKK